MTGGLATSSSTSTLPLEACPDCDYALAGLPAEGVCPECGRAYDQETLVLFGRAGGGHANMFNARPRTLMLRVALFGAFLVLAGIFFGSHRWWIFSTLAALAYLAMVIGQRRLGRRAGMAQVRVNAAGYVQDDNPADGPYTGPLRMLAETFVGMLPSSFGMISGPGGTFFVYFWATVVILAMVGGLVLPLPADNRGRRLVAALPGGAALMPAWRGWWTPVPVPWSQVREAKVEPLKKPTDEATHVLIIKTPGWGKMDNEPVHLQFRCTPEQAAELSGRMVAWREFSRQGRRRGVKMA